MRYTILDLAVLVQKRELELAPGSETIILGGFVAAYDYVSRILNDDTNMDTHMDITEDYLAYKAAYDKIAQYDIDYAGIADFDRPYLDPWE